MKRSARRAGLSSADLVMHSVDFAPIAAMQTAGQWDEAGQALAQAAQGLEKAAQAMLICTVTMHLVADAVAGAVDVPLIHVIDETAFALKRADAVAPCCWPRAIRWSRLLSGIWRAMMWR
jgi:aspartate racemase